MSTPERPGWPPLRTALWAVAALAAVALMGTAFVNAFRPPPDIFTDFVQEWLSARNYFAGIPVYTNQVETLPRHAGATPVRAEDMLPWNAHPPASILLVLPLAPLNYRDGQMVWNLVTGVLFVLAVALVVRELGIPFRPASVLPVVVLVLICHPLNFQLVQGQLNFVLAFLVTLAWAADRRGYSGWAGAAVGAAAAIKLYPGFLFVYFVFTRRWSALLTGAAVFLALNGLALALFGLEAFRTYVREVVPSVVGYQTSWRNVSLTGFWLRLFDPHEQERIVAAVHAPLLGRVILNALRLAILLVVAVACRRAKTVAGRDRAFAACLVGMLLVSPIVWSHYFLLLLLPLGLVWMRLRGVLRVAMWAVFVVMWMPENTVAKFVLGPGLAVAMSQNKYPILSARQCFLAAAPLHLALVGLFVLTLLTPTAKGEKDSDGGSGEGRLDRRPLGLVGRSGPAGVEPADAGGGGT